jgi:type VI secretion system protein ImpH
MAPPDRRRPLDLIAQLEAEPHRFRFAQALRLLEAAGPVRTGRTRLRSAASLGFPPGEVLALARTGRHTELTVGFLGLTGPAGVLPNHYTERVMERRDRHRDGTLHAFLDLFTHRAAALLHEAWRKHRVHLGWERGGPDRFPEWLRCLAGFGAGRRDRGLAAWAGLLARRPLAASALESILAAALGAPAALEPFRGQWQVLPAAAQARLGSPERPLGGLFLGSRLWERQTRIGLRVGPLTPEAFQDLLPGRPGRLRLEGLVRTLLGHGLGWDLTLVLARGQAPAPRLGGTPGPAAPGLGITLWLPGSPLERDLDDTRFRMA